MLTLPIILKKMEELEEELELDISVAFWPDGSGAVWKNETAQVKEIHFEFEDLDELEQKLK